MSDANYRLLVTNQTGYDIYVTVGPWADGYSSCITIGDGSQGQLGSITRVPFGANPMQIFFWRSGSCHGEQGWLSLMATYDPFPSVDDYQQFWFDTDGGFEPHGKNASYSNSLNYSGQDGDTRIYNFTLHDAAQWPSYWSKSPVDYPLDLKYTSSFNLVWNDSNSGAIFDGSVYQPALDGYYQLGFLSDGTSCYNAIDHHSGASMDCSWWRPIPPAGFKALGTAFKSSHDKPPRNAIMCVREDLAVPAKAEE